MKDSLVNSNTLLVALSTCRITRRTTLPKTLRIRRNTTKITRNHLVASHHTIPLLMSDKPVTLNILRSLSGPAANKIYLHTVSHTRHPRPIAPTTTLHLMTRRWRIMRLKSKPKSNICQCLQTATRRRSFNDTARGPGGLEATRCGGSGKVTGLRDNKMAAARSQRVQDVVFFIQLRRV